MELVFKALDVLDCEKIKNIDASQYIKRAYREVNGIRQLVTIDYFDPDWPNGYEEHYKGLKNTIMTQGIAIGVFHNEKMVGFATVEREVFGVQYKHVLLDQMFISSDYRNKGIGKKLFLHCCEKAKAWNVDKLYICAGSAEETIAFYFAIGCKEAVEINQELYESDPRDYQLEYSL